MTSEEMKAKVLKLWPDAVAEKSADGWRIRWNKNQCCTNPQLFQPLAWFDVCKFVIPEQFAAHNIPNDLYDTQLMALKLIFKVAELEDELYYVRWQKRQGD